MAIIDANANKEHRTKNIESRLARGVETNIFKKEGNSKNSLATKNPDVLYSASLMCRKIDLEEFGTLAE